VKSSIGVKWDQGGVKFIGVETLKLSTLPLWTFDYVSSVSDATLYQGNPNKKHNIENIVSDEKYALYMQVQQECCYINLVMQFH
jgi:hypothetical protein